MASMLSIFIGLQAFHVQRYGEIYPGGHVSDEGDWSGGGEYRADTVII